ncbi:MAG: hypothetical protein A2451_08790 [Bdellovibrionales bacterium RIFOXYC2_FULL_39_8]|nr:MAG: hypothetical protein A2385_08530 [Bdellovibrionales bacterium RIFOXYB1_FULL_39_21]OFZ45251.1 MAG: hypothetical protein A2485_06005 [Bdellovibrionales bacterium RIFOXYC12_FULL_39_17]OFZ74507.1 MAG: hypothetical protein A2451_08790 [Bdellovibrionales bacterium RIFOXYC2_FULL_39_8]
MINILKSRWMVFMQKFLSYALAIFFIFSCQVENVPETALKRYIDYRLSNNQNREDMLSMVSGQLKASLLEQSDEELAKIIAETQQQRLSKFKILFKTCDDTIGECNITYIIAYDTYQNDKKEFSVEVKKIATMALDAGIWKVADVKNLKTNIDNKSSL